MTAVEFDAVEEPMMTQSSNTLNDAISVNESTTEVLPGGNSAVYDGSTLTKNNLVMLVMAFVLRHKLNAAALQDLLTLVNLIAPGSVPASTYFLDKLFCAEKCNAVLHYYCANSSCMHYFGPTVPDVCATCGKCYHGCSDLCGDSYMLVLPLEQQLRDILQSCDYKPIACTGSTSSRQWPMRDVIDGIAYGHVRKGESDITLQFNCDGAPVFTSSKFSIWPLVCTINELSPAVRNSNAILHTIWFGRDKPQPNAYLQPFVLEMNSLHNEGFTWFSQCNNTVMLSHVSACLCVCDAPAHAILQSFTQYNGNYGCGFCYHPGEHTAKGNGFVRVYPIDAVDDVSLRTHDETLLLAEAATASGNPEKGVKGCSSLFLLPDFNIIDGFVPEYMHSVLLGVVRQFVNMWTDSASYGKPYHIKNVTALDNVIKSIKPPDEVRRLPRTVDDRKFWKASEYCNFLLFYSPVALMNTLPKQYYMHWLLLVNALNRLLGNEVTEAMIKESHDCLTKFVLQTEELYGVEHVSYNVHLLTHLTEAVDRWGPLWAHSAFVYEDVIGLLKSIYHGTQLIPKQLIKYFCAWKSLAHLTPLMLADASQDALDLFDELCCSQRHRTSTNTLGGFVGLGKYVIRKFSTVELVAINNAASYNVSAQTQYRFFDRFKINNLLLTTRSYGSNFKRNNCLVTLDTGHLGEIVSCVVISNCVCNMKLCVCAQQVILLVNCYSVVCGTSSAVDDFVGINLTRFIHRRLHSEETIKAVRPDNISGKCICVPEGGSDHLIALHKCILE